MRNSIISKLMDKLPEGKRKQELMAKYNNLQTQTKKRGGDGLQDTFEFKPEGHIRIEEIDSQGNVVGMLADQPNLVVNGAEEILLRAFSGDPNRTLYKNRKVLDPTGVTGNIFIQESKLNNVGLFDGEQLLHAPNLLWTEAPDEEFEVTYGYYPTTLYIKEEVSTELGKKAFSISNSPSPDRSPIASEIYSTYTNLFIGIGEGKNYSVPLTDPRLAYTSGFAVTDARAETKVELEEFEVTAKISNFAFDVETSNQGAQIDVFINSVLIETVETYNSNLSSSETLTFEYGELDYETDTVIKLVHSGSDGAVTDPTMAITAFYFDELDESMNSLMKEFNNFETEFVTPTAFNTTPMGPYTINLPNFPILSGVGTVNVTYEGVEFTEVDTEGELTDTTFVADRFRGVIQFNRALTGVMVTYKTTGEIYDSELTTTMIADVVTIVTTVNTPVTETPTGIANGVNREFLLSNTDIVGSTLIVKVDSVVVDVEAVDEQTGLVTLTNAPVQSGAVTAEYEYVLTTTEDRPSHNYTLEFPPTVDSIYIVGQDDVELKAVLTNEEFVGGTYMVDPNGPNVLKIAETLSSGDPLSHVEIRYLTTEQPGVPTDYTRAVIEKPKTVNEYPWFELDNGAVRFVAEFPELKPAHNVTIREMGLFDGPRADDKIAGFRNYPVKAFSLVRVGETRKEMNTGIRITWTITLLNSQDQPFKA